MVARMSLPTTSSVIARVLYDVASEQLDIELRTGRTYRYLEVPAAVHQAFMAAESKGRFYNDHIRDVYLCKRLR
jgi:KTSC domain-containing protein